MAVLEAAPEGTVVQADVQNAGRGRFGNAWVSPAGNLYMTVVLRPPVAARFCAQASFVAAVALADALAACGVAPASINLKWPNDVLVDGAKIAGILLEMETGGQGEAPAFLLAGIGVNIMHAPEGAARVAAFAPTCDVNTLRGALLHAFDSWYGAWLTHGFASVRARWLAQAYGVGQPVTARMADRRLEGVFDGIDSDGNLLMQEAGGGVRPVNSGDIHFAPRKG